MHKIVNIKNFSKETLGILKKFNDQEGSDGVACGVTIEIVKNICDDIRPKRILEMGGGIGTISYLMLKNSSALIDIYEPNKFCRTKLEENLVGYEDRYNIIKDYKILPLHRNYDIIIVDGGAGKGRDEGFPSSIWFYINYLSSVKVVYIDRIRWVQAMYARKALRSRYTYKVVKYVKETPKGERHNAGTVIRCQSCKSGLKRWVNFLFYEIGDYRMKYFIVYRIKRIKKFFKLLIK